MPTEQLSIRQAGVDELDIVMALLEQRVRWLEEQGSDQWSTWGAWRSKIEAGLVEGSVWLLFDEAEAVGTITVEFQGDPDFWTERECAEPAVYLSKLAIRLDHSGRELGALLTAWARDYAYRHGCKFVRLDAWKTNEQLHRYYAERGWKYLRTVQRPGRNSGALFQLPVQPLSASQRERLREDLPYVVLPSRSGSLSNEPDPAGNQLPHHIHRGGMEVALDVLQRPGEGSRSSEALFIDGARHRLEFDGQAWELQLSSAHFVDWKRQGTVVATDLPLQQGQIYVLTHQQLAGSCRMVVAAVPAQLGSCAPRPPEKGTAD